MENITNPITIFVLLLGYVVKTTPKVDAILPYYALIAFVLGVVMGGLIYGYTLDGMAKGAADALVATGIYEATKNTVKAVTSNDDTKI